MKTSVIVATIASLASLTAAFDVAVTFRGGRGERFGQSFPTDASSHAITNPMIVFEISSPGGGFCTFVGAEGETVVIYAEDRKKLKKPQRMVRGSCDNV
ncbi:hypothetical protein P168DRAFT_330037 [Aspergillus campestris IBT 28561]|uniref:Uncharacterized protein n=1 Tax=Aspergillus campestris (strain IBT 28561) TaxID=1392248 RepID=A0A2I1CSU4_ASPC2|nr:uncharacterized protein P168DRAFT_330037 [Aspergillus campestris IBT 28561]PKY00688.1 hypothetical protein P168DRAFT_330037 [Aspergillus campestris IBT 28561]